MSKWDKHVSKKELQGNGVSLSYPNLHKSTRINMSTSENREDLRQGVTSPLTEPRKPPSIGEQKKKRINGRAV